MCDDVMLYAKASRGFKAGGFDTSDRIGDAPQYEDEQVTAFETGSKTTLFDGRAEINASFSMETMKTCRYRPSTEHSPFNNECR